MLCHGVVVMTTAQLHSTKPELKFCTSSDTARSVLGICNGEDLWQWPRLEIRLNAFRWSTIPQKQFIIIIIIIIIIIALMDFLTAYLQYFVKKVLSFKRKSCIVSENFEFRYFVICLHLLIKKTQNGASMKSVQKKLS